jgi:hypothetical protein
MKTIGICSGNMEVVQRLIESKVDVNEGNYDFKTPMHLVNVMCTAKTYHGDIDIFVQRTILKYF